MMECSPLVLMMEKSLSPHEEDSPIVESLKSAVLEDLFGQYSGEVYKDDLLVSPALIPANYALV